MTTQHSASSPAFSFRRWWMLWQYYMPQMKRQLISYPLASLVLSLCLLLPLSGPKQCTIYLGVYLALGWMFYLAPIVFAKFGDSRIIERLIPATPLEKLLFYLVYLLIVVSLCLWVFPYLSALIYLSWPAIQTPEMKYALNLSVRGTGFNSLINLTGNVTIILTCLYFVVTSRRNRVLKGLIGALAAYVGLSLMGGIMGYYHGVDYAMESKGSVMTPEQEMQFTDQMLIDLTTPSAATIIIEGIECLYIGMMIYLIYRWLKRGNL